MAIPHQERERGGGWGAGIRIHGTLVTQVGCKRGISVHKGVKLSMSRKNNVEMNQLIWGTGLWFQEILMHGTQTQNTCKTLVNSNANVILCQKKLPKIGGNTIVATLRQCKQVLCFPH